MPNPDLDGLRVLALEGHNGKELTKLLPSLGGQATVVANANPVTQSASGIRR